MRVVDQVRAVEHQKAHGELGRIEANDSAQQPEQRVEKQRRAADDQEL